MNALAARYFVLWKGRQTGPFTLEQLRSQLHEGQISRLHQIGDGQRWQPLEEFMTEHPDPVRRTVQTAHREAQLRSEIEARLTAEEEAPPVEPSPFLPRATPPPARSPFAPPPPRRAEPFTESPAPLLPDRPRAPFRTSGLAVAAFVLAICNFIPFVNFLSWILALVFGHTALGQMQRDPTLEGRPLATAALIITYLLLVLAFIFLVLMFATGLRLPRLVPR